MREPGADSKVMSQRPMLWGSSSTVSRTVWVHSQLAHDIGYCVLRRAHSDWLGNGKCFFSFVSVLRFCVWFWGLSFLFGFGF